MFLYGGFFFLSGAAFVCETTGAVGCIFAVSTKLAAKNEKF